LLYRIADAARRLGMLHKVVALHAILGTAEWPGVAELAERQAAREGVRFITVEAPGGLLGLVRQRRMWPDALRRLCTATLKRQPCGKAITQLVQELGVTGRPAIVLNAIGLRAEESPDRARRPMLDLDMRASSSRRLVLARHPLLHTTQATLWQTVAREGLEYHEVYDALLVSLSCMFCVLAGVRHLIHAARVATAMGLEATTALFTNLEAEIGHTFKQGITLAAIVDEARRLDALEGPLRWRRGDAIRAHVGEDAADQWLRLRSQHIGVA
jgi:3'-phosphoadenosine 5'-phosphosulfate sulfotransferase (PAPS reductase)/FAD synthetase